MAGFNAISLKLKEMYQMITLGGDAELELVDSLDPFSEVRQPGVLGAGGSCAPCCALLMPSMLPSCSPCGSWPARMPLIAR